MTDEVRLVAMTHEEYCEQSVISDRWLDAITEEEKDAAIHGHDQSTGDRAAIAKFDAAFNPEGEQG